MICRQHLHELSLVTPAWTPLAHKTSGDCDVRRRRTLNPQTTQSNVFVLRKKLSDYKNELLCGAYFPCQRSCLSIYPSNIFVNSWLFSPHLGANTISLGDNVTNLSSRMFSRSREIYSAKSEIYSLTSKIRMSDCSCIWASNVPLRTCR